MNTIDTNTSASPFFIDADTGGPIALTPGKLVSREGDGNNDFDDTAAIGDGYLLVIAWAEGRMRTDAFWYPSEESARGVYAEEEWYTVDISGAVVSTHVDLTPRGAQYASVGTLYHMAGTEVVAEVHTHEFFCSDDWTTFTPRQLPCKATPHGQMADRGEGFPNYTEDIALGSVAAIVHGLALQRPRVSPLDVLARGRQQLESDRCDAMIDEMFL